MLVEKFGISTRGLVNENENGTEMLSRIWDRYFDEQLEDGIYCHIKNNCIYNNDYKRVDEKLKKLIGIYPVKETACLWKQEFCNMIYSWLDRTRSELPTYELRCAMRNSNDLLYEALYNNTDMIKGTVKDGNREIKVLKYIKSKVSDHIKLSDKEYEELEWYKFYVKHRTTSNDTYLVVTNSIASHLGMSSYAPKRNNNDNRVWHSCQTIADNYRNYSRGILCNIADAGSLVCYVTDKTNVEFCGLGEYNHNTMLCRWMLRLLKNEKNNEYCVALDRAYPNDAYTMSAMEALIDVCNNNNVDIAIHSSYNSSQNDNVCNLDKYKIYPESYFKSAHPIVYTEIIYEAKKCSGCGEFRTRCYNNCGGKCVQCDRNDIRFCTSCSRFRNNCVDENRDCETCNYRPCNDDDDEQVFYSHYDDQVGGSDPNNGEVDKYNKTYTFSYRLYSPIKSTQKDVAA